MDKRNLRQAFLLEISALEAALANKDENDKDPEKLRVMLECWKRALSFFDEPNTLLVQKVFCIGHLDYSDAMDLAGFFTRRGNKVTVERIGEGLTQDWYRIKVEGNDGELLRRQFDA